MSDLHGLIMNIRIQSNVQYDLFESKVLAYKHGHRDGRHAAAELAIGASQVIDQLRAELAGLRTGFDAQNEVIAGLRKSLLDASEEIYAWGSYASDYFQEKHDLVGCVEKFHAAAMGKGGEA